MKVSGFTNLMQVNNSNRKVNNSGKYSNLAPLKHDTVSFGALLKPQLGKTDFQIIQEIKSQLFPKGLEKATAHAIFAAAGIGIKENLDKTFTISHYRPYVEVDENYIRFSELGINENELMKNVKEIANDADFYKSEITELPKLETIGGTAKFLEKSKIKDKEKIHIGHPKKTGPDIERIKENFFRLYAEIQKKDNEISSLKIKLRNAERRALNAECELENSKYPSPYASFRTGLF